MISKIKTINENKKENTVDITTNGDNLFLANGILTHNSGMNVDFNEVDLTHIGESLGISASCDFLAIMGKDEEQMVYESELLYKIVKNRLGGRVNEIGKFYVDKNSLKLYDETELQCWFDDAKLTQDERKSVQKY